MVEVIVRNVAAGSFSKKYGVPEGTALNNRVVEFSLKSDELGDPMINDSQITAIGVATQAELDELRAMALRVDELMTELFAKCGIRLVDFKLEFGRAGGELLLCDEISPDSCRLWDAETNRKMDKDRFHLAAAVGRAGGKRARAGAEYYGGADRRAAGARGRHRLRRGGRAGARGAA